MSIATLRRGLLAAAALIFTSGALAQNAVRIAELHYDNAGVDAGEAIELSAPTGASLTGWKVVLYNGNDGAAYDTRTLTGTMSATCGTRGVMVLDYPSNGIQNGAADGIALVDPSGTLVEFLSYEGTMLAINGPAAGITSTDIGVSEDGNGLPGTSLARNAAGAWSGPASSTFGACNDNPPPPSATVARVTISPSPVTLNVGGSVQLHGTAFDALGNPIPDVDFLWDSRNESVLTVNANGLVKGLTPGVAAIHMMTASGVQVFATGLVELPPPPPADVHINEIHYDNSGSDVGEAIEIEGPTGTSLEGLSLVLYNGDNGVPYNTRALSGALPASCGTRGVVAVTYGTDGIQNGPPDGIALVTAAGQVVDFVSYEGSFTASAGPAVGTISINIDATESSSTLVGSSLQRNSSNHWVAGAQSFGACNPDNPTPVVNSLSFSGRNASDPALPVGFEDQLFATLRSPTNVVIPTTITWSSDTPDVASIDQRGVVHALAEGTAVLRATADEGTTATWSLPTRIAVASTTAQYGNNTEFGDPTDADSSDDFIVRHEQYTTSYNPNRGTPNWVSYDLDASQFGSEDRCDCFTMDPDLPAGFPHLDTADYTGAGEVAGYGIDRGHLARSFDRTTGSLDNARTFLLDNIIPQASDQNQGPWAVLENYLGDQARLEDREVYIVAGVAGNKGTVKNEGKIVIPEQTWKVALILPRDKGLADVVDYRDVQAIAVIMPNDPGIRNNEWQSYETTIDAVEQLSGYDLFALLPDKAEAAIESNTQPPFAALSGPGAALDEGGTASFSAAASVDPNGSIVSFAWDFGDGAAGDGETVSHIYANDGDFTVHLTVTDNDGLTDSATMVVHVHNVAPAVAAIPDADVNVAANYTLSGSFTDPGADAWTGRVNWGDGSNSSQSLAGNEFSFLHSYASAGNYTVTVEVADDDEVTTRTLTVRVADPSPPGLAAAIPLIEQLVARHKIHPCVGGLLKAEVRTAQMLIARGKKPAAIAVLRGMVSELDFLVRFRMVSASDVAPLRTVLVQAIRSLGG